jgi:hypothetical protein
MGTDALVDTDKRRGWKTLKSLNFQGDILCTPDALGAHAR